LKATVITIASSSAPMPAESPSPTASRMNKASPELFSELRKRKRRRLVSLTGLMSPQDGDEVIDFNPPDEQPLQDVVLVDAERRAVVKKAIATLPERYRAPLVLRDVEGKSYDEIAAILRTSEGTVKSRINRARNFLRDKMQNYVQVV